VYFTNIKAISVEVNAISVKGNTMNDIALAISVLVEELKSAQSQSDLTDSLEAWKKVTGFDWYLFALNRSKSMQVSEHIILTNYPSEWMQRYESEKLYLLDPVVKYVMNHQNAIFWDTFKDMDGYNSPEQLEIFKLAAKHSITSGCSIPCNSYGNFAVFSMANTSAADNAMMNDYLPYNHLYANQLLESVLRVKVATETEMFDNITHRETECLFWGSEGKTAWEISKILGISERTVVFHFTNVAAKLNATNRQHAISKALLYGIVKPTM